MIVDKYSKGLESDDNEIFVPDYQREMAWSETHQSKFIESVLIGLPIPYLFVADIGRDEENDGRLEIVDGSQRIRTLHRFLSNELKLQQLEKLESLNGFRFSDLPVSRQRRFKRRSLRMIELTEKASETVRRDIFERINTGSIDLEDMEKRRGIRQGPMLTLVEKCAANELFNKNARFTQAQIKRRDREELVLRFFAYQAGLDDYQDRVGIFLNDYLDAMNKAPSEELDHLESMFVNAMKFAKRRKPETIAKSIGRIAVDIFSESIDSKDFFSGNVDAKELKNTATRLGVSNKSIRSGAKLVTIKTNRNYLAHGHKSFDEIGANTTVSDLRDHTAEAIWYMKGVISNFSKYLEDRKYLKSNAS